MPVVAPEKATVSISTVVSLLRLMRNCLELHLVLIWSCVPAFVSIAFIADSEQLSETRARKSSPKLLDNATAEVSTSRNVDPIRKTLLTIFFNFSAYALEVAVLREKY